jgi:TetR/AcrR family transcriptional regulator, transcriptional repressor for nem operon
VIEAAKNRFWERGYDATTVSDLEQATGLNRSSLYLHFGPKRSLFALALDQYVDTFINPLVRTIVAPPPSLEGIVAYFSILKDMLVADPGSGQRGCLLVNAIASLPDPDAETDGRASAYRDRLRQAFADALGGVAERCGMDEALIARRAWALTATTFGIWISARIDPADAAKLCDAVVSEVRTWDCPPSSPGPARSA